MPAVTLPKAVVFDLGGVLIDWNPDYLYTKLIPDRVKREAFYNKVCTREWHEHHDVGVSFADNARPLLAQYAGDPEMQKLITAWGERFFEMFHGVFQGTLDILNELHARAVPLYALTNWSDETFKETKNKFPFLRLFKDIVVSGVENVKKPDLKIYEILLRRVGLNPQDIVFIDDREENLKPARELGIVTIHFTSPEALRADLQKLSLL